jgi:hypothetical protein
MLTRKPGAPSTDFEGSLIRVLAVGYHRPELLHPGDLTNVWQQEWWAWSGVELATLYQQHRSAVHAAAARVGLSEPWCLGELAVQRARDAEATAWRRRPQPPDGTDTA